MQKKTKQKAMQDYSTSSILRYAYHSDISEAIFNAEKA